MRDCLIFYGMRNVCGTEGNPNVIEVLKLLIYLKCSYGNIRLTDWNSRTEQRERPQRDRFIARDIWNDTVLEDVCILKIKTRVYFVDSKKH